MTTTTTTNINDFTEGFGETAERYRAINEKFVQTGKKTANAVLDGYEKALGNYVEFRQQLAGATQLDWVSTVVRGTERICHRGQRGLPLCRPGRAEVNRMLKL